LKRSIGPGKGAGERSLAGANLLPDGVAEGRKPPLEVSAGVFHAAGVPYLGQLLRVFHGEGAQANGIHQLENRGVRADAEGEREDHHHGERGRMPETAGGIPQVEQDGIHFRFDTPPERSV